MSKPVHSSVTSRKGRVSRNLKAGDMRLRYYIPTRPTLTAFIKHKSFAFYKQSVPLRVPSLIEKVQSGDLIPMGVLSDSVLQKVLDGFEKSNQTPLKSLRFLELIKKELG